MFKRLRGRSKSSRRKMLLAIQHLAAMFGATTLVPLLTGLSVPVALFSAGVGTLLFHLITKRKVPVFLGSSFAFIPVIIAVGASTGSLQEAQGGIVAAGLIYMVLSYLVYKIGIEKISNVFQAHIVGTMIFIIGVNLIPVAVDMMYDYLPLALLVAAVALIIKFFGKGFIQQMSIVLAIGVGYTVAVMLKVVDFAPIAQASWFAVPEFTLPKFSFVGIATIVPVVLAVFMEHIGDITANGTITGKNYLEDPGLHRTLLGDGVATVFAGLIGGPANTTYSENTGVLALTKNYNPQVLRIAAWLAIVISFVGKLSAVFATIPTSVLGGISIVLFGMIAMIGAKTLWQDKFFFNLRKIAVVALMLGVMLFIEGVQITELVQLSSISVAAIVGIVVNEVWKLVVKIIL